MENHPIPQDVTGFKFKLVGSITLKQFFYLLGGGVIAILLYLLPGFFIIKLPFMLVFLGFGAALAFLPVEGRPMDVMIKNYIKDIPRENEYIYRKRGVDLSDFEFLQLPTQTVTPQVKQKTDEKKENDTRKAIFLSQMRAHYGKTDERETQYLRSVKNFFEDSILTAPVVETPKKPIKQIVEEAKERNVQEKPEMAPEKTPQMREDEAMLLQKEIEKAKLEQQPGDNNSGPGSRITGLEEQLANLLKERDNLQQKVIKFEVEKNQKKEEVLKPSQAQDAPKETQSARFVAPQGQLIAGFPTLPDIPNVILGIVKDPRGKVLPNILVEVVDQSNIPVRAFKTNALGQFVSATPLPNGVYKMFFEDAQKVHEFDTIEVSLIGEIFNPLEIFSIDQREKLRQELFGGNVAAAPQ